MKQEKYGVMNKRIFLAALLCGVMSAKAEVIKDGPSMGYASGSDVEETTMAFGYQGAYEFNDNLAVEVGVIRQLDKFSDSTLTDGYVPFDSKTEMELWGITVSVLASHKPNDRVKLYIGGGAGYYIPKADDVNLRRALAANGWNPSGPGFVEDINLEMENAVAPHFITGISYRLTKNWEVFADFRRVFLDTDVSLDVTMEYPPEVSGVPGELIKTTSSYPMDYNHDFVRVGANFRF